MNLKECKLPYDTAICYTFTINHFGKVFFNKNTCSRSLICNLMLRTYYYYKTWEYKANERFKYFKYLKRMCCDIFFKYALKNHTVGDRVMDVSSRFHITTYCTVKDLEQAVTNNIFFSVVLNFRTIFFSFFTAYRSCQSLFDVCKDHSCRGEENCVVYTPPNCPGCEPIGLCQITN